MTGRAISRRGFLAAGATGAAALALAGCTNGAPQAEAGTDDRFAAPADDAYPLEPDGDEVEALWASEKLRKDGWTRVTNPEGGVELGVMDTARILQVDGLAFRDMNGDGKVELWEDWRQPAEKRAAALAASLTAEQCFPLLWAGGTQDGFTETDPEAMELVEQGSRAGVSRLESSYDSYASDVQWINSVQSLCESSELGIPYLNYSDPYSLFGVPDSAGLAATMDKDLWRKAGMWQARAWRATGVRMELGPQVDVYSNPLGSRLGGSVSEDPALNRDFAAEFGGGMQSTWGDDDATDDQGWGADSCAVMLKHFVGEGAPEGGRNDHMPYGKWSVFPGSNYKAHLIPFLDGGMKLHSKTEQMAAIMPCYGICYDPANPEALGEHVGSAYSSFNMGLLRDTGWDGMLCTDWTVLSIQTNGVENLSKPERYARFMKNTISQHGGSFEPDVAKEAYDLLVDELGEDKALSTYQDNCAHIFKAMVLVNLFDQPYSDRDQAAEILQNPAALAFGEDAANKCIVMLKNKDNTISKSGLSGKVYVPQAFSAGMPDMAGNPGTPTCELSVDLDDGFEVVTDKVDVGDLTENSLHRLTKDDLADVSYAVIGLKNPQDAYGGVENGITIPDMLFNGKTAKDFPDVIYHPISLQYRPFTADGDYIRDPSLNPADEYGDTENRTVKGQSTYATNEADLDLVLSVRENLPAGAKLIVCIDASNPMCFHELEPACDAILFTFGKKSDGPFARILAGEVEPSGLLPYQQPLDMQTVYEQLEDVPRDMECYKDSEGHTYDFCFGLNWSGVIDDDRVKTYSADPLTEPETEVSL